MPRRARVVLPNVPLHVIQRGNNRSVCFFADEDYQFYLKWLASAAREHGCAIHAYCLMTNHVHLLLTSQAQEGVGGMMKSLGQRYVQYINRTYQRSGTLWEGRFRSCLLQEEDYVLACYRYIELNPVRAAMVAHPADYRWSSYRANAQDEGSSFLQPQGLYASLGNDSVERRAAYRELFRYQLDPGLVDQMRGATNGNFALGGERFLGEVAVALGRRVSRGKSGRPWGKSEPSGDL
ncbi:MAG: transposase [Candidatus Accumulibacter sp.]|nr:transposase [Accumulibacter sp.]